MSLVAGLLGVDRGRFNGRMGAPGTEQVERCPACGEPGSPVVYGLPGNEAFEASRRGEIILGGCEVSAYNPNWSCRACGEGWRHGGEFAARLKPERPALEASRPLVYGLVGDRLVVLGDEWARAALRDKARWGQVRTYREALDLDSAWAMEVLDPPFGDSESLRERIAEDGRDLDDEFDLGSEVAVQEMSWPGALTRRFIPAGWGVGGQRDIPGGADVKIDPSAELEILRLAARDGLDIRRDDTLVGALLLE